MDNLWPDDLIQKGDEGTFDLISRVLEAQAKGVGEHTNGLVGGFVKDRSTIQPTRAWSLELFSAHSPDKTTPILIVRSADEKFPVVIERFDADAERYKKVTDSVEFLSELKKILSAQGIREIVEILAEDAKKASAGNPVAASQLPPSINRTLLIGGASLIRGRSICHVVLLDVAGFIDADDLKGLLVEPDSERSIVQSLNGRFVVTVKFQDSVKFTISPAELNSLKAQVRQALKLV